VPDDTQVYSVRASVREIFVREDAVDTCNKYSQEETVRHSGEYCHEMLSGKQVVKWMLSGNLENAVRETNSQAVASNSLLQFTALVWFTTLVSVWVYYIGLGLRTLVWVYYIGLGLLHWFGFTTLVWFTTLVCFTTLVLVWVYYIHRSGLPTLVRVYYIGLDYRYWFGFITLIWVYRHWFGFTDIGLGLLHWFGFNAPVWAYYIFLDLPTLILVYYMVWVYYTGLGLLHWFGFTDIGLGLLHWVGF